MKAVGKHVFVILKRPSRSKNNTSDSSTGWLFCGCILQFLICHFISGEIICCEHYKFVHSVHFVFNFKKYVERKCRYLYKLPFVIRLFPAALSAARQVFCLSCLLPNWSFHTAFWPRWQWSSSKIWMSLELSPEFSPWYPRQGFSTSQALKCRCCRHKGPQMWRTTDTEGPPSAVS